MARVVVDDAKLIAIADEVRAITGGTEPLSLGDMAENIPKAYEAGKTAEWNAFWDAFQDNGNRRKYGYAFYGTTWNDITFKPKYDIILDGNDGRTGFAVFSFSYITDLAKICEEQGIVIDGTKFAPSTNQDWFNACYNLTRTPPIPVNENFRYGYFYGYCTRLHTVEGFYVHENVTFANNVFSSCGELQNLTVIGTIGQSGLNVQWSTKLSKASIKSVMTALSTTTSGLTVTFSKTAVNNAFGIDVDDPETYPEGSEWYELRNSKSNWNFNFI